MVSFKRKALTRFFESPPPNPLLKGGGLNSGIIIQTSLIYDQKQKAQTVKLKQLNRK